MTRCWCGPSLTPVMSSQGGWVGSACSSSWQHCQCCFRVHEMCNLCVYRKFLYLYTDIFGKDLLSAFWITKNLSFFIIKMSCYTNIYVCGYIFWIKTMHAWCDWWEYISRYGSIRANIWDYLRTPGHLSPANYVSECFVSLGLNFRDKGWFRWFFCLFVFWSSGWTAWWEKHF